MLAVPEASSPTEITGIFMSHELLKTLRNAIYGHQQFEMTVARSCYLKYFLCKHLYIL